MHDYFCGWYFKCQSDTQTVAAIAAVHRSKGQRSCSIQLITDENAWNATFPYEAFRHDKSKHRLDISGSSFSKEGMTLHIDTPSLTATGAIDFGRLSPIKYDIMGPFRYIPFMECRHSIVSMNHTVNGSLDINGKKYRFKDGAGYIEGDRGSSFPSEYVWTQCCFENGSLMLSAARIPLGPFPFTGIISIVKLHGREYRLATYLGARLVSHERGQVVIRQGDMMLSARLIEKNSHPLAAPRRGVMDRTIHESASCRAAYHFQKGGRTLLELETDRASFEYEYR